MTGAGRGPLRREVRDACLRGEVAVACRAGAIVAYVVACCLASWALAWHDQASGRERGAADRARVERALREIRARE